MSAIEPEVFEARAVIDAVDHRCQALEVWFAAVRGARIKEYRAGVVFDQFPLDLPYSFLALLGVRLGRLAVDFAKFLSERRL
jgi:hypothetical protein